MHIDTRNSVITVLLAAAALVSWYFARTPVEEPVASAPSEPGPLGYYFRDAVLFGSDEDGRIYYTILARQVSQSPERDFLELDAVRVQYRASEEIDWQVEAERAEAPNDRSYLELTGAVQLTSAGRGDVAATAITTERLRLEPDNYLASTELPVVVRVGNDELTATGMKAYLRDDRLELEAQVHGQFRN